MRNYNQEKNEAGLSPLLIVVLIFVLITGFVVWRSLDAQKTKQQAEPQNLPSSSSQSTDPYKDWEMYCDTTKNTCFKYPSNWTIDSSSHDDIVSVILKSPGGNVVGVYSNYDVRDGTEKPYYTASIDDLAQSNANYKVLGGFTSSATPVTPLQGDGYTLYHESQSGSGRNTDQYRPI